MTSTVACAHCGQSVPALAPEAVIRGVVGPVCCMGCAAAAQWIAEAGLEDYYRFRDAAAPRPDGSVPDFSAWSHADLLRDQVRAVEGGLQLTVVTDGMRCAACAWLIDQALRRLPGVLDVGANAITGRIRIAWDPARSTLPGMLERLHRLGFNVHLAPSAASEAARLADHRRDLIRLGIAGLGAMQAMMLAEAVYLDSAGQMDVATRDFFRWFTFLVSTPVVFFSGWPFLAGLVRDVRARHFGMDTLVGSAILLAHGGSAVETLRGGPQVWFDAAVMFVLLLLAARQLEQWARRRAGAQVDLLARTQPTLAIRETPGGREQVPLTRLRVGDVLHVAPGETVPADGTLLDAADVDESLLTGEPLPVTKEPGHPVLAGSSCGQTAARLTVTAVGADTQLSLLQRLIEQAQLERPPLARLADRIAGVFVPVIFVVTALVYTVWWIVDPSQAFAIALAVLVVSCPCALSLAIPTALTTAYGVLARHGVLALRGDALETLTRVDTVILDKTGTLTEGRPRLLDVRTFGTLDDATARRIAHALQAGGRHPLSHAFAASSPLPAIDGLLAVPGEGIAGQVDGRPMRLGRADFAAQEADDGAVWLGDGQRALARFEVGDAIRSDAKDAITALAAMGIATRLSSGDGADAVARVAQAVGIAHAAARQSPAAKLDQVRTLQRDGLVVAMVGDGINDAPVLAGADVSFAFGSGAAIAHRHADFVLTGTSLRRVPESIALARRTRRIVRQSLAWAIVYNLVALPFAALGWVEPWVAALGMASSSLLVTLNALRLRGAMHTGP